MSDKVPAVYAAICAVQKAMSEGGIAKNGWNQGQSFAFRGIDSVYNALAPVLAANGLTMLPRVVEHTATERVSNGNKALFSVTVKMEFDLVAASDGSKHTICMLGEAMDSGDKATNKAMSAAYKYAAFQAFCIPTEGDNDADAHNHEVQPRGQRQQAPAMAAAADVDKARGVFAKAATARAVEWILGTNGGPWTVDHLATAQDILNGAKADEMFAAILKATDRAIAAGKTDSLPKKRVSEWRAEELTIVSNLTNEAQAAK